MEARSLKFIAEACSGEIRRSSGSTLVKSVCTDSRRAQPGDLFFAIKGEHFDGHDFLAEAAGKKVAAVVVERAKVEPVRGGNSLGKPSPHPNPLPSHQNGSGEGTASEQHSYSKARMASAGPGVQGADLTRKPAIQLPDCAVLVVDDVRAALGRFAAAYRREFDLPVICVGGSNGKTTVKELIASVLRRKLATLGSEASFNNDIGVPLSLLRLEKSHQAAVLEAGTNHPGELAALVNMIQPKFGVITNIGREHLEFFGDLAGVAQEEGRLAERLPPDGALFIAGDSEWTDAIAQRTRVRVVRVGFGPQNDWRANKVRLDKNGVTFQVEGPKADWNGEYRVNLLGRHQAVNALLAVAVGEELGLGRPATRDGLADCQPAKMRLQFWEANGVRILDDAYNANADSMLAALETLCALPLQGRRVAVLGDMNELGHQSEAAHAEIGKRVACLGIGQLFAIGKMAPATARAARAAGLSRVMEFADVDAAVQAVKGFLKPGDVVLLKASRAVRLERITETLKLAK